VTIAKIVDTPIQEAKMIAGRLKELRRAKGLTLDELAAAVGTSKQTIHRYENGIILNIPHDRIRLLAEALGVAPGALMGWEGENSSFEYNDNYKGTVGAPIRVKRVPIIGTIACGEPVLATEEHESFAIAEGVGDADFCLRASGDSMTGARIYDGDIVFIRSQSSVDNGEVAAVIINDEATLKRVYYYPAEGKLILSPENPRYAPLVYIGEELNNIRIIGKAIAFQSCIL
jgi:repressor LexA